MKSYVYRLFLAMLLLYPAHGQAMENSQALGWGLGIGALTLIPSNSLEQTYYLGVFDPREQVPESFYRVRIRGQGSLISNVRYASGWAPANMLDTLTTDVRLNPNDQESEVKISGTPSDTPFKLNRRLVLFGPEGFREAPIDHRLVIVMGGSPHVFFDSINKVLGGVPGSGNYENTQVFKTQLLPELNQIKKFEGELSAKKKEAE